MAQIQSYRELLVWQKNKSLALLVYRVTVRFAKEELFALTSQARRSAISIPSNIAEGYGRGSRQEYIRFLKIARGSLYELQTLLDIAFDLEFISSKDTSNRHSLGEEIEKMLNALIKKLLPK